MWLETEIEWHKETQTSSFFKPKQLGRVEKQNNFVYCYFCNPQYVRQRIQLEGSKSTIQFVSLLPLVMIAQPALWRKSHRGWAKQVLGLIAWGKTEAIVRKN